MIGVRLSRVLDQGGSRKVVALIRIVEHLLKNMKVFHAGIHVRIGQAEGAHRRGSQTKGGLINVARRISALNFVSFALAVGDALHKNIAPLALKAQRVEVGAGEMDTDCHNALAEMQRDMHSLAQLRRWCFISCVLHTYLNSADLRNAWEALMISSLVRAFPRLTVCLRSLIWRQRMAGVCLSVEMPATGDVGGVRYHTLSPRCQCPSMRTRPGAQRGRRACVRVAGRFVWVPEWVAHSAYSKAELAGVAPGVSAGAAELGGGMPFLCLDLHVSCGRELLCRSCKVYLVTSRLRDHAGAWCQIR